tara:strand:- start:294 stop:491 length:198 start_codon:yes stop_codon:yes gene_type:complete
MEDAGSGNWMGNLINAIITNIIGVIGIYLTPLMVILGTPGWGYDLVMSSSPGFGTKVESLEIAFN